AVVEISPHAECRVTPPGVLNALGEERAVIEVGESGSPRGPGEVILVANHVRSRAVAGENPHALLAPLENWRARIGTPDRKPASGRRPANRRMAPAGHQALCRASVQVPKPEVTVV